MISNQLGWIRKSFEHSQKRTIHCTKFYSILHQSTDKQQIYYIKNLITFSYLNHQRIYIKIKSSKDIYQNVKKNQFYK